MSVISGVCHCADLTFESLNFIVGKKCSSVHKFEIFKFFMPFETNPQKCPSSAK